MELQEEARRAGCRVAVFTTGDVIPEDALEIATAFGRIRDGSIWVEHCGDGECVRPPRTDHPIAAQIAAALAAYVLRDAPVNR
jgi:hypothetical protein